jgi:hypothetical protein
MKASDGWGDQPTSTMALARKDVDSGLRIRDSEGCLSFDDVGQSDVFEDEINSSDSDFGHWGQRECLTVLPHCGLVDHFIDTHKQP